MEPELRIVRTYFVRGAVPNTYRHKPAIKNPPTSGKGVAVLLQNKRSITLFSPFTLEAHIVSENCSEVAYAQDLIVDHQAVAAAIVRNWKRFSRLGIQRDYGAAASILKIFGVDAPDGQTPGAVRAEKARKAGKGGGKATAETTTPLKKGTKRAAVAEFFRESAMIQQAMHELNLTRSGVLSHLHCIHKYNGFGYILSGDSAELVIPEGVSLFKGED
jgi:hypothetical protein